MENLELLINLTCMFLGCVTMLENQEKGQAHTVREYANSHSEKSLRTPVSNQQPLHSFN